MDDQTLTRLAAACQRGDERGFRSLVDTLTRPLIAVAYRYTGDWEWARDLTQETWVRVHARIHTYDPGRPFRAWLYAIHRNGCLSHLRRGWVRHERTVGEEAPGALTGESRLGNPEDDLERVELRQRLTTAIDALGDRQRQVFLRVDVEGRDPREVAAELGIEHTTLRSTLHFARRRLARTLKTVEEPL